MSYLDRYGNIRQQIKRDKFSGRSNNILGDVFHLLPGDAGTHLDYARSMRKNASTNLDQLYGQIVSGRGDAVVVWPGAHTPTASIVASKDNVTFFGWDAWINEPVVKSDSVIIAPAADEAFNITGVNMKFIGLTVRPVTAKSFADFTGAADGLTVRNCFIDLVTPVVNIATEGFTGSAAIDNFLFENNVAWSDGAQGPAVELTGANLFGRFRKNLYHVDAGSWASAVNMIDIDGIVVEDDLATCGGTAMTACFTGSGTTVIAGVLFKDCRKGVLVTKFIDGFETTTHAEIVGNHTATIGGGNGETLITVVT